jgi:DNA-binding LytR/AlgR family response regulator
VTTGDHSGTNGWARGDRRPWLAVACVTLAVTFVNATSVIMDASARYWMEPVLWETTSAVVIIALAPLIGAAMQRWPPRADKIFSFALIHLGLTIPFALAHIAFIFVTRETAYAAVGARYGFFDDGVALTLLYEWRKDVLVYGAIAVTYWVFDFIAAQAATPPPAPPDARIEIRDAGAAVFLAPSEISHVEAAGNYVEFHTTGKAHLVRGTLAAWEAQLAARGFVRVHRSRLVNRAKIAAFRPTKSGDLEISLTDGRALIGSRRYRVNLEARATERAL